MPRSKKIVKKGKTVGYAIKNRRGETVLVKGSKGKKGFIGRIKR